MQNNLPVLYVIEQQIILNALLNKFKLAQTEKGSFILNVDIQVVDENNEQIVLEGCDIPTPFEHKVIERIGTAISQVDAIVNNQRQLTEMAGNGI